jgi:hypothetical protein
MINAWALGMLSIPFHTQSFQLSTSVEAELFHMLLLTSHSLRDKLSITNVNTGKCAFRRMGLLSTQNFDHAKDEPALSGPL